MYMLSPNKSHHHHRRCSWLAIAFAGVGLKTPPRKMKAAVERNRFILPSLAFIVFLCLLASINELRVDRILKIGRCALSESSPDYSRSSDGDSASVAVGLITHQPTEEVEEIRVLIGILTLPDQYHRRHFLRLVYGTQPQPTGARVDVRFVFCNLTKEDQKVLVALEIMRYADVLILNCAENMNKGKTYSYFSSLPEIFAGEGDPPYHYVMKADDDAYFRLENLVASLRPLSRTDLYYGYVIPCPSMDPFVSYMSGMGYLISWDLVEWVSRSEIPKKRLEGPEDKIFGEWVREGRRAKNRFNAKWSMYNYPKPATRCTHELWPDTVAVHLLKSQEKWIHTLNYFNATANLKKSKLYHI